MVERRLPTGRYVHHLATSELEFHDALIMRLLLPAAPVFPTAAKYCSCSYRAHLPSDHSHFLDCAIFMDKRHNMIRDAVFSWLKKRLSSCEVRKEVPYGARSVMGSGPTLWLSSRQVSASGLTLPCATRRCPRTGERTTPQRYHWELPGALRRRSAISIARTWTNTLGLYP